MPQPTATYLFHEAGDGAVPMAPWSSVRVSVPELRRGIRCVIGRPTRDVTPERPGRASRALPPCSILGFTIFAIPIPSMLRVKGMDGFCPVGPGLVTVVPGTLGPNLRERRMRAGRADWGRVLGSRIPYAIWLGTSPLCRGSCVDGDALGYPRSVVPGDEVSLTSPSWGPDRDSDGATSAPSRGGPCAAGFGGGAACSPR